MRTPIIAGNWKMHKTIAEALSFVDAIRSEVEGTAVDTVLCAPYLQLPALAEAVKDSAIRIGAQNMHFEAKGAFTGEISAEMLSEIGIEIAVIGHSERRQYFGETDATINQKTRKALDSGVLPIVCCGESLEEREAGKTEAVLRTQIETGLAGISADEMKTLVVAYEPIWAIGTGVTASSEDANEGCAFVRKVIAEMVGQDAADAVRIQYGGSVKPANVKELMAMSDIDGALVGGASLDPESFVRLVKFEEQ